VKTRIEVLAPDERAQVHERSLHVLAKVGMRVDSDEGRRILRDAGALFDESTRMVRYPPALVDELLALAPRQFSLGGRRPGWEFPLNAGESTMCLDGGPTMVLDRHSGERRPSTRADWLEAIRLSDAIDEIGMLWSPVSGWLPDKSRTSFVDYAAGMQRAFSRHVQDSFDDPAEARWQLEVLEIVFGGRGGLAGSTIFSFEQTLVDVEIWRLCRKAHAGIEVADDRWLTEALERVGPGGQFLSEKSTRVNTRSGEWHFSQLGWHDSCDAWTAAGCPDALDGAREKVDAILAAHRPLPFGEDVEGALAELRGRALRHDGGPS